MADPQDALKLACVLLWNPEKSLNFLFFKFTSLFFLTVIRKLQYCWVLLCWGFFLPPKQQSKLSLSTLLVHLCLKNAKLGRSGLYSRQRGPLAFLGLFPVSLILYFTRVLEAHVPCKTSSLNSSQAVRDRGAAPRSSPQSVKSFSGDQYLPWDIPLLLSQAGMAGCTTRKEG